MILTSKNNPLVKETATLKEKKGRKSLNMFLVEGRKMALECQKSGLSIDRIFYSEQYDGERLADLPSTVLSDSVFRYLSDEKTPQGVLCRVKLPALELVPPTGKCLFLDGISDPGNMGAILRTANAAGYREIYLTDDCTDPYSPKSVRASMSGLFFVKLYSASREKLLETFKDIPVLVADMHGENVFSFNAPKRYALVIGNEGNGVSKEVKAVSTNTVSIPMQGTQESLNASVAAGIAMYLLSKKEFQTE